MKGRITIYYNDQDFDLEKALLALKATRDTEFSDRSVSDIAKRLLTKSLQQRQGRKAR